MKELLRDIIRKGLECCFADGALHSGQIPNIVIEKPAHEEHGDFATNVAMLLAKQEKKAPRAVAEALVKHLDTTESIFSKVEVAGPAL